MQHMSLFKKCIQKEGQALAEFAIIFPLLILILFGIYEIGTALSIQQTITYAAREGARAGALTNENAQIESAIDAATEYINKDDSRLTVEISPQNEFSRGRGDELTVSIEYALPLSILNFITEDITLTSQAVARIET